MVAVADEFVGNDVTASVDHSPAHHGDALPWFAPIHSRGCATT
jgi:hypothetical protein